MYSAPIKDPDERFWAKVKIAGPDECWEWTAARETSGYGRFYLGKKDGESVYIKAHRYAARHMPIEGKLVCHRCDNPPCCNPAHLFPGTQGDNMKDMSRKGRYNMDACIRSGRKLVELMDGKRKRGSDVETSKLTEFQASVIKCARRRPGIVIILCQKFGVTKFSGEAIRSNRNWPYLPSKHPTFEAIADYIYKLNQQPKHAPLID